MSSDAMCIKGSARELDKWRREFINSPEAIEYCGNRAIRWESENEIYLLKKTQMNGAHAELYTYCLYHNSLYTLAGEGRLAPLKLLSYQSVNGTDEKPYIEFDYKIGEKCLEFFIEFDGGHFITSIELDAIDGLPEILALLCDNVGFEENEGWLSKGSSSSNEIQSTVLELAQELSEVHV